MDPEEESERELKLRTGARETWCWGTSVFRPPAPETAGHRQSEQSLDTVLDIGRDFGPKRREDGMRLRRGGSCTAARHLLRCPALVSPERPEGVAGAQPPPLLSPSLLPPPNTLAPGADSPLRGGRLSSAELKGSASPDSARFQGSEADAASSSPGGELDCPRSLRLGAPLGRERLKGRPRGLSPCPAALSQS